MDRFLIKGLKVYSEEGMQKQAAVMVEDGYIQDIFTHEQHQKFCEKHTYQFPANYHLVPGFIDMHIHGISNADVMDGTKEALDVICTSLPSEGTTSYLATTLTQSTDQIEKVLQNVTEYMNGSYLGAQILGLHLEGPFLSTKKPGVHLTNHMISPDIELFKKWNILAKDAIKVVTLAPEAQTALSFIEYLKKHHVIASIGHSDATFEQALHAIGTGCTQATHLFNAMSPIHQRFPGCSVACLLHHEVFCEIIVDGLHLHPAMVHVAYRLKGYQNLILVTDSIRAKGMPEGTYDLGGRQVELKNHRVTLPDGTLAGSVLTMDEALKNMHNYLQCPLEHLIEMTSTSPARRLNVLDKKGSIKKGKDADLVILNEQLDVVFTVCRGQIAFEKK